MKQYEPTTRLFIPNIDVLTDISRPYNRGEAWDRFDSELAVLYDVAWACEDIRV